MKPGPSGRSRSAPASVAALRSRLHERRAEIERAAMTRVRAIADPGEVEDPEYAMGLRDAVSATLDYVVDGIESTAGGAEPPPERLLAQARAAARNGVGLDIVLRRYLAGYALLVDLLVEEAGRVPSLAPHDLQGSLRTASSLFDHLVDSISAAYAREAEGRLRSGGARRTEQVKRLLAGEPVAPSDLGYDLDTWHLAAIASGPGAIDALRELVAGLGRSLLLVRPDREVAWAWLGGRDRLCAGDVLRRARQHVPADVCLALGEPGRGVEGWRFTHSQARAAMSVARRGARKRVRYADVALLSAALRDDVLASSLRDIYLAPLALERDGGQTLRKSLDAYFAAARNATSAAAALGVSRQTLNGRLRSVEERIGRPLSTCAAELETSLRLHGLSKRQGD